jgi:glycine cleavage system transcriptional repressor
VLQHLVVTVTGPDRPGIVQRLAEVLVAHGGNVESSRMAQLGGEFAAVLLASVPDGNADALVSHLAELEREGLQVLARPTTRRPDAFAGYVPYRVSLAGADHRGILHAVADFLAGQGVNIESLDTEVANAPETGAALFSMEALVQAPPALSLKELRRRLGEVADRFGVDIDVRFP